jgi:AbrB family looped-hinge helix DNA binding protein
MEHEYKAKVTSKGQVTIPVGVRRSLGLNPGDVLIIRESTAGYILEKAAMPSKFDEFVGYLAKDTPVSTDEVMREGKLEGVKIGGSRRFQREGIMRIAGAEPDVVAESSPTYGGVGDYAAITGTLMHRRMLILNQLRQRLQESRLASKVDQKSTEDLYPATRTLAEIRRERPDSLCNGDD